MWAADLWIIIVRDERGGHECVCIIFQWELNGLSLRRVYIFWFGAVVLMFIAMGRVNFSKKLWLYFYNTYIVLIYGHNFVL